MYRDKFKYITEAIENLGTSCELLGIQYSSKLSTLEVSVTQQAIQIKKLQRKINQLTGREEYKVEDVSDIYREKYPSVFKPVPYPYTHPIRDISAGGGKVKK